MSNSDKFELKIDLFDGLPPTVVETQERPKSTAPGVPIHRAPPSMQITRTPIGVAISVAHVHCLGCGAEHKDHRGIFIEEKLSNGVKNLRRTSLRELGAFAELPRRVDIAPDEAVPVCSDCWLVEKAFRDALAASRIAGDILNPDKPTPLQEIGEHLAAIHANQIEETKQ